MHWFFWVLVALMALSSLVNIACIGEERKPITPLAATISTMVNGLLIAGMFSFWGK